MNKFKKNPFADTKVHYKLVKSTKGWLAIGLTTLSLATASFFSVPQIHADSSAVTSSAPSNSSAGSSSDKDTTIKSQETQSNSQNSQSENKQTSATSAESTSNITDTSSVQSNAVQSQESTVSGASSQSSKSTTSATSATSTGNTASAHSVASVASSSDATSVTSSAKSVASYQVDMPTFKARWDAASVATTATEASPVSATSATSASSAQADQDNVTLTFLNADGTQYMDSRVLARGNKLSDDTVTQLNEIKMSTPDDGKGGTEVFNGWFYQVNGGISDTKFDTDQSILRDYTLIARFTRQFVVQYVDLFDGKTGDENYIKYSQTVNDGSTVSNTLSSDDLKQLTPPKGERFVYWYEDTQDNQDLIAAGKKPVDYKFGIEPVTKMTYLHAYFANIVIVTFKTDGAPVDPQLVTIGDVVTQPTVSRAGYKFVGWTTTDGLTAQTWNQSNAYNFTAPVKQDTTLYGVWNPDQVHYNIVFWVERLDPNGNPYPKGQEQYDVVQKIVSDDTVLTGSNINLSTQQINKYRSTIATADNDKLDAINFSQYDSNRTKTSIAASGNGQTNVDLYYDLTDYTFTFNYPSDYYVTTVSKNGNLQDYPIYTDRLGVQGSGTFDSNSSSYSFKAKYNQLLTGLWPVISGYGYYEYRENNYLANFYGWSGGSTSAKWVTKRVNLTEDMLSTANSNNDYTVTLTPNFVLGGIAQETNAKYYLETIDGRDDSLSTTVQSSENGGYYADLLSDYKDQFYLVGGKLVSKQVSGAVIGDDQAVNISHPDPDNPGQYLIQIFYRRSPFNLSFDAQDGVVGDNSTKQIKYQAPVDVTKFPTPTRTGYVFDGWYVDASGTQPFVQNGQAQFTTMPARAVTLFAKWTPETYRVRYFADYNDYVNGKEIADTEQVYGLNNAITLPEKYNSSFIDPSRGVFDSWNYINGSSAIQMNNGFLTTRNYDLFASYQSVKFNVKYLVDQTKFSQTITVPIDNNKYGFNTIVRLADNAADYPTKPDTVFLGWQDSNKKNYMPGDFVRIDNSLVPNVNLAGQDLTLTFTARFVAKAQVINVTFDPNLNGITPAIFQAAKGDKLTVPSQSYFNVTNNKLLGWSQVKDGSYSNKPEFLAGSNFTADTDGETFKAIWQPVIKLNDGCKTYDGTANLPADLLKTSGESLNIPSDLTAADFDWQLESPNKTTGSKTSLIDAGIYSFQLNNDGIQKFRNLNANFDFDSDQLLQENKQGVVGQGTYTINKAPATITVNSDSETYTGDQLTPPISFTGLVNNEKLGYAVSGQTKVGYQQAINITLTAGSTVNANYTINPINGFITITKAPVTVKFNYSGNRDYNGESVTTSDIKGVTAPDLSTLAKVDLTTATYVFKQGDTVVNAPKNQGIYDVYLFADTITAITNANPNLDLTGLDKLVGRFTIGRASVKVKVGTPTVDYDGQPKKLTDTDVTVTGVVNGEKIDYIVNNDPNQIAAGTYAITAIPTSNSAINANYTIKIVSGSLTIQKSNSTATMTLTSAPSVSQVYDGKKIASHYTPTATIIFDLPNNQTAQIDAKLMAFEYRLGDATTATIDPKNVGTYSIYLTADSVTAIQESNENINMTDLEKALGTYTITQKPINVTVNSDSKEYNTEQQNLETATIDGVIDGEKLAFTYDNQPNQIDAGEYSVNVKFDADSSVNKNYILTSTPGTLTIKPAEKAVQFTTDGNKLTHVYDRTALPTKALAGITAQLDGQTVDLSNVDYEYQENGQEVTNPMNVGSYDIYLTTGSLMAIKAAHKNYDLSKMSRLVGKYVIKVKPVTITVQSNDKVKYDGKEHDLVDKTDGVVHGDDLNVVVQNKADQVAAGKYQNITAKYDANANYDVSVVDGELKINKVAGDVTLTLTNPQGKAQTYNGETIQSQYMPKVTGALTFNGQTKSIDLQPTDFEYRLENVKANATQNVGKYTIYLTNAAINRIQEMDSSVNVNVFNSDLGNYEIDTKDAIITVVDQLNDVYDGTQHNLKVDASGMIGQEQPVVTVGNQAQVNAGTYTVNASYDAENDINQNYHFTVNSGTLKIAQAASQADFKLAKNSRAYTGHSIDQTDLASMTATFNGTTLDLSKMDYSFKQGNQVVADTKNIGSYDIYLTQTAIDLLQKQNTNYHLTNLAQKAATYTITKQPVTISFASQTVIYDGQTHQLVETETGIQNGEQLNYVADNPIGTNVGAYNTTVNVAGGSVSQNYDIHINNGLLTINQQPLTVKWQLSNGSQAQKEYDGQPIATGYTPQIVLPSQLKWGKSTPQFAYYQDNQLVTSPKNAGHYTIQLTPESVNDLSTANPNFDLGKINTTVGMYKINRAAAQIIVNDADVTYDGIVPTLSARTAGVVKGERLRYTVDQSAESANVGTYQIKVILDSEAPVNANYQVELVAGNVTIAKLNANANFVNNGQLVKVYDGQPIDYVPTIQLSTAETPTNTANGGLELMLDDDADQNALLQQVTLVNGDYQIISQTGSANLENAGDYQIRLTQQGIDHIQQANPNIELTGLNQLAQEYTILKRPVSVTVNQIPTRIAADSVKNIQPTATVVNALDTEPVLYTITGKPNNGLVAGQYQLQIELTQRNSNYQYDLTGTELTVVPVAVEKTADAIYAVQTIIDIVDQHTDKTIKTVTTIDNPGRSHNVIPDITDNYHIVPGQPTTVVTPKHPGGIVKVVVAPNEPVTPIKPVDGGKTVTTPVTPIKPVDGGKTVTTPVTPIKPVDGGKTVTTPVTPVKPVDGGKAVTTLVTPIKSVKPTDGSKVVSTTPVQPTVPTTISTGENAWDPILVIIKTNDGHTVSEHTVEGYVGTTVDISNLIPEGFHLAPGESKQLLLNDVTPQVILIEPDTPSVPTTAGPTGKNKGIGHGIHLRLAQLKVHAMAWKPVAKNVARQYMNGAKAYDTGKPTQLSNVQRSHKVQEQMHVSARGTSDHQEVVKVANRTQHVAKMSQAKSVQKTTQTLQNSLPQTGEKQNNSLVALLGIALASLLSLFGLARRKKETDETK